MNPLWSVAIFAHNEAHKIAACLDSLEAATPADRPLLAYVIANGCTDNTEQVVQRYAMSHPRIRLIASSKADKCSAWNLYVHDIAPKADVHFFIDGDVEVCEGSLGTLAKALETDSAAHAAAAFPASGRNRAAFEADLKEHVGLAGNLYALRGDFLERMRAAKVALPSGLVGEDGLVGALAKWDLDPRNPWRSERIRLCPDAHFRFSPLSLSRPADWRLYWRRRIRYSRRDFEFAMLAPTLKEFGLAGMYTDVAKMYRDKAQHCRLRWKGLSTIFDFLALRHIRTLARNG